MMPTVVACILAGGEGTRLLPLTARRAKPAIRFGGSYRLIDFPLSNCVNSEICQILAFPQYNALCLERHLRQSWSFLDRELDGFILSLPPQELGEHRRYRGTADAIYQNLATLERLKPAYVLILAADHVYRMDYRRLLQFHQSCHAEVTLATFPVPRHQARQFGIVTADPCGEVISFQEKPQDMDALPLAESYVLASMGIYLFTCEALREVVQKDAERRSTHDFGRDILPAILGFYRVAAFPFLEGIDPEPAYWRDVGTIDAYWQAHMDLLGPEPRFPMHNPRWPLCTAHTQGPPTAIFTPDGPRSGIGARISRRSRAEDWMPVFTGMTRGASFPRKRESSMRWLSDREVLKTLILVPMPRSGEVGWVTNTLVAQGCMLQGGCIDRSILSPGVCIEAEAEVQEAILFDGVRVGRGAKMRRAILDRGVVVPSGMSIGYDRVADGNRFTVSEGGVTVVG